LSVVGEDGVEEALEEAMAGVWCAEDADGGDGHWFVGIDSELAAT